VLKSPAFGNTQNVVRDRKNASETRRSRINKASLWAKKEGLVGTGRVGIIFLGVEPSGGNRQHNLSGIGKTTGRKHRQTKRYEWVKLIMPNYVPNCSNFGSNKKGHRTFICSRCKNRYCDGQKTFMGDCPHCGRGVYTTLSVVWQHC